MLAGIDARPDAFRVVAGETLDSASASLTYTVEELGESPRTWTRDDAEVELARYRWGGELIELSFADDAAPDLRFQHGEAIGAGVYMDVGRTPPRGLFVEGVDLSGSDVVVHDLVTDGVVLRRLRLTAANGTAAVTLDYTAPDALTGNDGLTAAQRADLDVRKAGFAEHGRVVVRPDGTFTYTPEEGFVGVDTFGYFVRAAGERSQVTEVTVEVAPPADLPGIETAPDSYGVPAGGTLRTDGAESRVWSVDSGADVTNLSFGEVTATDDRLFVRYREFGDATIELLPPVGRPLAVRRYWNVREGTEPGDRPVLNIGSPAARLLGGWVEVEELRFGEGGVVDALTLAYSVTRYDRRNADVYQTGEQRLRYVRPRSVADNDPDAAGRLEVVRRPGNGRLRLNPDGTFEYTPDAGFLGVDSFAYRRRTALRQSEVTVVTLRVESPPAVEDVRITAFEDLVHADTGSRLFAADPDTPRARLTYRLIDRPSHGNLWFNADASFTYTPDADFAGVDSFTYAAHDGVSESAPARVTIDVRNRPDRPRFGEDRALTVREDAPAGFRVRPVSAVDVDSPDPVRYVRAGGNTAGIFDFDGDTGELIVRNTLRLEKEQHRTYQLLVDAIDGQGQRRRERYTVDVLPVDDLPRLTRRTPIRVLPGRVTEIPFDNWGVVDADTPLEDLAAVFPRGLGSSRYDAATRTLFYDAPDTFESGYERAVELEVQIFTRPGLRPEGVLPADGMPPQTLRLDNYRPPRAPAVFPFAASLPRNTPAGAVVGAMEGRSLDGTDLRYALTAGNEAKLVRVDAVTGEVRVVGPLPAAGTTLELTVTASDSTGRGVDVPLRIEVTPPREILSPRLDVAGAVFFEPVIDVSLERVLMGVVGSADFSARSLDLSTARFGATGWEDSLTLRGSIFGEPFGVGDFDEDGFVDLLAEVDPDAAAIVEGRQLLTFTARTTDGQWVRSRFEVIALNV